MEHPGDIDLKAGLPIAERAEDGLISGRVDGEEAILVRRGKDYFAVGATCTHHHGTLALHSPSGLD
jgi:nitrite reductase/ring-hydroxylating ferredoxin subunit